MKNIHEGLKEQLKESMKAGEKTKVSVIRDLLTAFANEAIKLGKKAQGILDDDEAIKIINTKAKQRKDSIESFEKGGRDDLVQKEKEELKIINEYLPEQLSDEEIEKIVIEVIKEAGAESMAEMGQVMSKVMEKVGIKADGSKVSAVVRQKLQ
jgi:hypothetical protein